MTRVPLDAYGDKVRRWRQAKNAAEKATRQLRRIEQELREHLGDAEVGTIDGQPAVCQETEARDGIDIARLREDNPDLLRQYPIRRTRTRLKLPAMHGNPDNTEQL